MKWNCYEQIVRKKCMKWKNWPEKNTNATEQLQRQQQRQQQQQILLLLLQNAAGDSKMYASIVQF